MSGFVRGLVAGGNDVARAMNVGDGYLANPRAASMAADAASTITVDDIAGGLILRSGMTADRIDTSPTATLIAAAFPNMDIGDSFTFKISNQVAGFQTTIAGGTGVTASGNLVVLEATMHEFVLTKTGAATFDLIGL